MKQIIFTYNDIKAVNIGDYIQSLAAKQFASSDIVYVNRDELGLYNGDKAKVIMNGWYTYKPSTCLPSKSAQALFVAFHLNAEIIKDFLSPYNISILKKYEPIGCRDSYTQEQLQKAGIKAYYSGCLTMTLGYNFKIPKTKSEKIVVVDPYAYMPNGKGGFEIIRTLFQTIKYISPVRKLLKKYKEDNKFTINLSKIGIGRILLLTKNYILLKQLFDNETIWNAHYITQLYLNKEYPTDDLRFKRATELLQLYTDAKYIVTSRIHCAFPCLGLQTPVAYIKNDIDSPKSLCRLGNVTELLHVIEVHGEKVVSNFLSQKFTLQTTFSNKDTYIKYRNELIQECTNFFKEA